MFLQVKGEGLNVGCVLTWGPCYDYQRRFFDPRPDGLSEPLTVIKYDVEVSGFGSQALGHVCLLNLRDQTYPGSDGTATKGWPTWTTPVLRWAKAQGAVTGYAHSGSGLEIDPQGRHQATAGRPRPRLGRLAHPVGGRAGPAAGRVRPGRRRPRRRADPSGARSRPRTGRRHAAQLRDPRDERRRRDGGRRVGARGRLRLHERDGHAPDRRMEHVVPPPQLRVPAQGQRRDRLPLHERAAGSARGGFTSGSATSRPSTSTPGARAWPPAGRTSRTASPTPSSSPSAASGPGDRLELEKPGTVAVQAKVAFAARTPLAVAHGGIVPAGGRRLVGDTVNLHGPRRDGEFTAEGELAPVELVVNGRAVASRDVPADDQVHELRVQRPDRTE